MEIMDTTINQFTGCRSSFLKLTICLAFLGWGLMISLQPPFYPYEAELKGANPEEYGSVFGAFYLGAFLTCPIAGAIGRKIGPKTLCIIGALIQAVCTILFGFLDQIEDKDAFIGGSLTLRFLSGMAEAAAWNAGMTILVATYPAMKNTMMALTETAFGTGMIFGPALGSFLYTEGGFGLPFWVVGGIFAAQTLTLLFAIPKSDFYTDDQECSSNKKLKLTDIFTSLRILVPYWDLFVTYLGYGLVNSMLEEYMDHEIHANEYQIDGTFTGLGLIYMVFALLSGYLCDRMKYPGILSIPSNINLIVCFIYIGPLSLFQDAKPTWISVCVCTTLMGISFGSVMVTSMGRVQKTVANLGFDQDWHTDLLICGMWSTVFYFSNFLGPSVAGVLVENFGFRHTSSAFPVIYMVNLLIQMAEYLVSRCDNKSLGYQKIV